MSIERIAAAPHPVETALLFAYLTHGTLFGLLPHAAQGLPIGGFHSHELVPESTQHAEHRVDGMKDLAVFLRFRHKGIG